MPRIYKPTGPSVALREAQRGGDPGFIQAPSQVNQIDSLGRQSQSYLQSFQQQANRNAEFQQTTLARAQRAQESNAQLALQQQATRDNLALRASEIQGQQNLAGQELQMRQQSVANQISLDNQKYQANQLTEFGDSLIKFSATLWNKKAEQINKENEELRLKGLNDYLSGNTGAFEADVARVNQAEIQRTQGLMSAEAAALQLEQAGQKADATMVRAANPFYLRGQEEGQAMKAGLGYPTYLQSKVREAIDKGLLNILDPNFTPKLSQLINVAGGQYIKENGLAGINPGVLAKYFGYTKAQVEAQVLENYGNQAYKTTKQAQQTTADAMVYNSAAAISAMPRDQWQGELQKLAANSAAAYSMDPLEGSKSVLQQLIKFADQSGSFDLADAFMTTDRGDGQPYGATPGLQELYDKSRGAFVAKQAAQLEKLREDQIQAVEADFNRVFTTGDVNAIREAQDTAVARLMQLGTPEAMAKARSIASTNPGESPMIQEQLRRAEDGGYLDRFLRENRDRMTNSTYERYAKRAENVSKINDPAYKEALNQVLIRMKVAAGEANELQDKQLPPHAKQALKDFTKLQQDKLRQFAREWLAQNQGSNLKDFEDWLKGQEKSYADPRQFVVDPKTDMPRGMQSLGGGTEFTGNPLVRRVTVAGRMREDYRAPQVQAGLASGSISGKAIQFNTDIVFTQQQISDAVTNYEKNGTWPQFMVDIASRTGRSVKSMVQAQARVYGGSGVIMDPGNFKLPPSPSGSGKVSFDAVLNFGKAAGMSQRGAIAFATMVQAESGGDPLAVGDNGTAFGLLQYRLDRQDRLSQFAAQKGKPISNPEVQLQFTLQELRAYPSVWSVLTSPNPTTNQLWRATKDFLRFSSTVEARRLKGLQTNLGETSSITPQNSLGNDLAALVSSERGYEDVAMFGGLNLAKLARNVTQATSKVYQQFDRLFNTASSPKNAAAASSPSTPSDRSLFPNTTNAKIAAAAEKFRDQSTRSGPGFNADGTGGELACAWAVNRVLRNAGIPIPWVEAGQESTYVPFIENAIRNGGGSFLKRSQAKPGDLVSIKGDHLGIVINKRDPTTKQLMVLSNSSSWASFSYELPLPKDGDARYFRLNPLRK